jgi:Holliday junction DNA helicase RuvA
MIAAIEGTLELRMTDRAIIKLDGVSLQVHMPTSTLNHLGAVGERVKLFTRLQLRGEDIALYGFASQQELEWFKMLTGVNGISTKAALAILSTLNPEQLALAISSENVDLLTQVPGIGKKTARRLVMELKGKVEKNFALASPAYLAADTADVAAALSTLGYSTSEIAQAIAALPYSSDLALEDKVKLALCHLAKQ